MKKYKLVVDVEGLAVNGRVRDYLPKYNGLDTFDHELEAYKMALMLDRVLCKVSRGCAHFRVREFTTCE